MSNLFSPLLPAPLDSEQLARFEQDGFLIGLDILSFIEVNELRKALQEILDHLDTWQDRLYEIEKAYTERPNEVVCHFLGGLLVHAAFRKLVFLPRVTLPLAQLLNVNRLRFFHDQVFYKPVGHPGVVPWHQDYSYWTRTTPACHITMNIMLDEANEESGCLQFIPGSHNWGLLPSLPFDSDLHAIKDHLTPQQLRSFKPVAAHLKPGQATIHHSHTLHGSTANRSNHPRRALVLNYMAPDTRSATDEPLLKGTPVIPKGRIVQGEYFPLVC